MQWYYLSDSFERIPMSEAQFPSLAARGVLRPATPVWRKGMADWTACGEVKPEIFAAGVTRVSDDRHPAADSAAVRGTVIGLSRTLAGYNGWMRVLAAVEIFIGAACVAMLTWETYMLVRFGFDAWSRGYAILDQLRDYLWVVWLLMSLQALTAALTIWCGALLLRGAARAKRAVQLGNEHVLTSAVQDVGRYLLITAVMLVLTIVCWLSIVLWFGWDKAFPPPPSPAERRVTV